MINPELFVQNLRERGFGMFSGVPCSYLTPLINTVIDAPGIHYVGAANEGDAVAVACGAQLGGVGGVVMFQNSGLGNAVSPLTSLTNVFEIPVLVITTWRGEPGGKTDEPQHALMGEITPRLLDLMGIEHEILPADDAAAAEAVDRAVQTMRTTGRCYGLLMRHGSVEARELRNDSRITSAFGSSESRQDFRFAERPKLLTSFATEVISESSLRTRPDPSKQFCLEHHPSGEASPLRFEQDRALASIQSACGDGDVILATTGFTGRALYALDDRPNQLYMVGSMGCVSSLGLGLALAAPERRVVVIDGDGAALMRMGALPTLGAHRPPNLVHVLLDNGAHDSTGTQATVSPQIDFPAVALASGYPRAVRIGSLPQLADELSDQTGGLKLLHVRTKPRDNRKLPRPTMTPAEVARRLADWIGVKPWTTTASSVC